MPKPVLTTSASACDERSEHKKGHFRRRLPGTAGLAWGLNWPAAHSTCLSEYFSTFQRLPRNCRLQLVVWEDGQTLKKVRPTAKFLFATVDGVDDFRAFLFGVGGVGGAHPLNQKAVWPSFPKTSKPGCRAWGLYLVLEFWDGGN